jgi:ABC-2 type transport system permease protein
MLTGAPDNYNDAIKSIEHKEADIILQIPNNFEKNIQNGVPQKIMLSANAVNGMKGSIAATYITGIMGEFGKELMQKKGISTQLTGNSIEINQQFRFNPHLYYQVLICGFLPAFSIVMEKESGTIEQMNVSPVSKVTFILAKLIPFWIMGFIVINIGFFVAWLVYGLWPVGHFYTIYVFALIYILTVSGLGLIISNLAQTLQQAMFIIFFFMLVFIMLSGLYTPIDSMPDWAKGIAAVNPLKYFMEVMRAIYLKGSGLIELWKHLAILIAFTIGFNTIAVLTYRKNH